MSSMGEDLGARNPAGAPSQPVQAAGALSSSISVETGLNRTVALMGIPRRCAANLRGGAERPLEEIAGQLKSAIDRPEFLTILERRLDVSLDADKRKALFPAGSSRAEVLVALRLAAHEIVDAAVPHFQSQRDSKMLKPAEMTLYNVFTFQKISKTAMDKFASAHVADEKKRPGLIGPLRLAMKDALQVTLVLAGETLRESQPQRAVALVGSLELRYLARPEEGAAQKPLAAARREGLTHPKDEIYDAVRLGRVAAQQDLATVREFLTGIENIPRLQATMSRRDDEARSNRRMQRAIAELLVRHPQDQISEAHFHVVNVIREIAANPGIRFHPYVANNDPAVVDALYAGFKLGKLCLSCASCPNYSGEIGTDPVTSKPQWRYTFETLGREAGIVAERGFDFVSAWVEVLRPRLGQGLTLAHFEGTFEVAQGFTSARGEAHNRTYPEAVECLRASGEAVRELYRRKGIELETRLTSEVLPDSLFLDRKKEIAATVREQVVKDPKLALLVDAIYEGRKGLYAAWYPMRAEEGAEQYVARLKHEVVPENVAEYVLLGRILTGAGGDGVPTLALAYDSPWMGEVYAHNRFAVISGQGARAMGYLGA